VIRLARRHLHALPLVLTGLRALLAPVVIVLALYEPSPAAFAVCLIAAFLSDVFDGIVARRLGVASSTLRRLDSAADTVFYGACVFAAWHLYPVAITDHVVLLAVLAGLEALRYALDFAKFHREASYHMWSSKLWGIALFVGFFGLLVFGNTGAAVTCAIVVGIVADLEGLAISIVMPRWKADVPTLLHALRERRRANQPS
jgi:phosphatidylglycerophosphate synthase